MSSLSIVSCGLRIELYKLEIKKSNKENTLSNLQEEFIIKNANEETMRGTRTKTSTKEKETQPDHYWF